MNLNVYRLDSGSLIVLIPPRNMDPDDVRCAVQAFGVLGVSVVVMDPEIDVSLLVGPGHPIELTRYSGGR